MGLAEYQRKRDFRKTSEPPPETKRSTKKLHFVVQKHDATRLHYDFRLELDGVLKSWAVPRGPSLDPAVKSLAVEVEDHPVAYAKFEGIIPAGEYGGGTVIVWDRGTWKPTFDPHFGLKKGHLEFELDGEKLHGRWHLVRIRKEGERQNWLLMKGKDEHAIEGDGHGLTEREQASVVTGRTIPEVAEAPDKVWTKAGARKAPKPKTNAAKATKPKASARKKAAGKRTRTARAVKRVTRAPGVDPANIPGAREAKLPRQFVPQLATLTTSVPTRGDWLHEIKFDGYRIIAIVDDGNVRLLTRKGLDWTARFPTLAAAVGRLGLQSAILDGELVANDERGRASFQRMQNALRDGHEHELVDYVFDLPYLNGFDLTACTLRDRKAALEKVLKNASPANDGPVRYSDHVEGNGQHVLDQACQEKLEGIMCKDANSRYEPRRTKSWLKLKCLGRQEFIICGFSKPERSRIGFGALLLGYYDDRKLRFAGRVGTGFDSQLLLSLSKRLKGLAIDRSPYAEILPPAERRGVTYVRPELVCEVEFSEWTDDGRLRHPTFQGLREDKPAREIVRENAATAKAIEEEVTSMPATKKPAARGKARSKPAPQATANGALEVQGVRITHPDRTLFPEDAITKGDLARYMESVADWILPHVADRPLTIVRCPEGTSGQCFYQKHWTASLPDDIEYVSIKEKDGTGKYLVVRDVKGLISLIQISALELHPWGSKIDRLENPDRIVFDLDPGPDVAWDLVCQGARDVRMTLEELGLASFVRTSGSKGLHVVVPLARRNDWDEVTGFAHAIASGLAKHAPDHFVANMRKALRKGKVFLDYLRNQRGSTAVASYSPRTRTGCPVAVTLDWNEIDGLSGGNAFNIRTVPARLAKLRKDPWKDLWTSRQSLSRKILEAAARFAE